MESFGESALSWPLGQTGPPPNLRVHLTTAHFQGQLLCSLAFLCSLFAGRTVPRLGQCKDDTNYRPISPGAEVEGNGYWGEIFEKLRKMAPSITTRIPKYGNLTNLFAEFLFQIIPALQAFSYSTVGVKLQMGSKFCRACAAPNYRPFIFCTERVFKAFRPLLRD